MKPVYVIVPVFNQNPSLLKKCIDSIQMQSYPNVIAVCVNDGTTATETLAVLDQFKDDKKFVLLNKQNGGVGSARNAGLAYVEKIPESYVTFVDSDDRLGEHYIESLVYQLEKDQSDAICSDYTIETDQSDIIWKNQGKDLLSGFETVKETVSGQISPNPFAKLYKTGKNFLGGWFRYDENLIIAEDVAYTFRTFLKANTVSISRNSEYFFNRYSQYTSLSRQQWDNKKCLSVFRCDRLRANFVCTSFSDNENQEIMRMLRNDCADNYLGILPRFNMKSATLDELVELKKYQKFIAKEKIVSTFKPYSSKTKAKKYVYLLARPLYSYIYRRFMR